MARRPILGPNFEVIGGLSPNMKWGPSFGWYFFSEDDVLYSSSTDDTALLRYPWPFSATMYPKVLKVQATGFSVWQKQPLVIWLRTIFSGNKSCKVAGKHRPCLPPSPLPGIQEAIASQQNRDFEAVISGTISETLIDFVVRGRIFRRIGCLYNIHWNSIEQCGPSHEKTAIIKSGIDSV